MKGGHTHAKDYNAEESDVEYLELKELTKCCSGERALKVGVTP
jgi:hypothetical protein